MFGLVFTSIFLVLPYLIYKENHGILSYFCAFRESLVFADLLQLSISGFLQNLDPVAGKNTQNGISLDFILQVDQINMAVLFLYIAKSDASVRYCTVAYTGKVTF